MTRIELKQLTIQNFKGVCDRVIDFNGNTSIKGANGTGKSTVYDAFTWLLFDKNSSDSKDFAIKPRQKNGEETHYLDIRVEGILSVDRDGDVEELALEKIYRENWVKKRGELGQEYSGNTTDHFINGVPTKAGEYKSHINSLLQEDRFKLLTSAVYFNSIMGWKERRELLFELANMGDESEIIGSYDKGELILALLNGNKVDDALKVNAATLKRLNGEIEKIPIRIDEVTRSMPVVDAQALRSMTGWCLANPTRRKTRSGAETFINRWLAKEQNRGGARNGSYSGNSGESNTNSAGAAPNGRDSSAEEESIFAKIARGAQTAKGEGIL